jgi:GAF domain-containing protein
MRKKAKTAANSLSARKQKRGGLPRAGISLLETIEILTEPFARSLESLLRLAADEIGAAEASILVRDERSRRGDLKFFVATGEVAPELKRLKVPRGKGIAGFVYETGQPIAVSDAQQDATFYPEVDRATGFSTQALLATPLNHDGETIGVLEFVNRAGAPPFEPFTAEEMDRAARYAVPVAALVMARDIVAHAVELFAHATNEEQTPDERKKVSLRSLANLRAAPEHADLLALAVLLREIAARGEAARKMCREILEALAKRHE